MSAPLYIQAAGLASDDNALRSDLTWLNNRNIISINLSTWPLSQEEIERALHSAKS